MVQREESYRAQILFSFVAEGFVVLALVLVVFLCHQLDADSDIGGIGQVTKTSFTGIEINLCVIILAKFIVAGLAGGGSAEFYSVLDWFCNKIGFLEVLEREK